MNRTIKNQQEFQNFGVEVVLRQYEVDPIRVDFSEVFFAQPFDKPFNWDNEYHEIVRIDNIDVVKLRSYST